MAWYRESFGEEYLELYAHRDRGEAARHVAFLEELFGDRRPRAVLDLACGAGRHTAALRARGYRALGVDLSLTLLALGDGLPRVAGDMRRLPFADAAFDWVLNVFTSFGYFESERENFRVLEQIVRVLEPHGGFLIDLMNLDATLAKLKEYELREEPGGRRVEIYRGWDERARRINKRIRVCETGREPRTFLESVRVYTADEVTIGLRWAGLEVTHLFGSFAGEPYDRDSERLILVGHKVA
ncbi:MAG TPA: class I SAM-dependent methyltransferase [Thermoanaerobaculia bacterium]|nr:class I SAM-dependent methyltransferase [Thermoanaerobaculia bacterium]